MLNPGDMIAQKYQVVRLIGQGGMSNVYLVRRLNAPANDPQWVIKEMTVSYRDPDDQKRAVDQFNREASLLQKLHHKNLPRVIDLVHTPNSHVTARIDIEAIQVHALRGEVAIGVEHETARWAGS